MNLLQEFEIAGQHGHRHEAAAKNLIQAQVSVADADKLALAQQRIEDYGKSYLGDIEKMLGLTRKAYESGELSILEFSIARDRFAQARSRSFDAALAYLLATAEIENLSPGCRS